MAAWFNKQTAEAMAKMAEMAESLKAESRARAEAEEKLRAEIETKAMMERKVKAEAEKMLVTQYNKYSVLVERTEAKAREEIATVRAQIQEAKEKAHSYAIALAQAEEKLKQAKEQIKNEAIARVKTEESLKSEREERERVEAQVQDSIAAAEAKAEKKAHSYAVALAQAEEKLIEAKGQVKAKSVAKAKEGPKIEMKEDKSLYVQPLERVNTFKRIGRNVFHPGNIKRKFILLLVLVIFSAITFALSVTNDSPVAETAGGMIKDKIPAPVTLMGKDDDKEQPSTNVIADPPPGSLSEPAQGMANAAPLNYKSADNVSFKVGEEKSIPVSYTQSVTIKAYPVPLKITASADSKSNIVRSSDNDRLETKAGSHISCEFSDVSVPANAVIRSVVLFVEHFEEERFARGKLEWAIGTGWPVKPVVWAMMKAPVHEGESSEAVDAWDITSVVNTAEKINSLQLQVKNNNDAANGKTLVDYAYVVVEYN